MNIDQKSMRLPEGQFIDQPCTKDLIVIHHTVGGTAASTFDYWKNSPERIGTAYIIERDGTIYETFPPDRWAFHLGLKGADAASGRHERRSIGIELASEGALKEYQGNLYCFDTISPRTLFQAKNAVDIGAPWRGRRWFDKYDDAQIASCYGLVKDLIARFNIPAQTVRDHKGGPQVMDGIDRLAFRGVLGHADLRADKTDPHPAFPWADLARFCGLTVL